MAPNPKPWAKALETVPEMFHSMVEPELERMYNEAQEASSKYDPYKDVVDNYQPEQLQNAVALADALERDPQGTFSSMAEFLKGKGYDPVKVLGFDPNVNSAPPAGGVAGTASGDGGGGNENPYSEDDPRWTEFQKRMMGLEEGFTKLVEYEKTKAEKEKEREENQQLEAYLEAAENKAREDGNPWDRDFVLYRIANFGEDADKAVDNYKKMIEQYGGNPTTTTEENKENSAPVVMGAGNLPSNQRAVEELDDKETEDLVVSFINAQKQAATT